MTTTDEKTKTAKTTTKATTTTKQTKEEKQTFCYMGPNLPDGALKKNSIIIATRNEIKEKFEEEIEKYPQLERLMVPVENLAEAKEKVETEGNILNKYYNDIASVVLAYQEKEQK